MDSGSVTQKMIFPRSRLPKKSLNWKSNLVWSMQVSAWFSNIPFHLQQIWMHTLVAINLESYQRSIPSFCALPSEVAYAVLLESYSLAVKPSHSELGNMGSNTAGCWKFQPSLSHFAWHWVCQCTDTSNFMLLPWSFLTGSVISWKTWAS